MGPSLTVSHWAPSWPPLLCRRRSLSTCAGIGRIRPRLEAIGTSANSPTGSHDLLEARVQSEHPLAPNLDTIGSATDEVSTLALAPLAARDFQMAMSVNAGARLDRLPISSFHVRHFCSG